MSEDWTPILAVSTIMLAIFTGIGVLKQISARLATVTLEEIVVCPNCSQPFDVSHFPIVDGERKVTCPRCGETLRA